MHKHLKHVRIGVMSVSQLGALVAVLRPYAGRSCASDVVDRAIRHARKQPLIGPIQPLS